MKAGFFSSDGVTNAGKVAIETIPAWLGQSAMCGD